jgi:hypothetical protein
MAPVSLPTYPSNVIAALMLNAAREAVKNHIRAEGRLEPLAGGFCDTWTSETRRIRAQTRNVDVLALCDHVLMSRDMLDPCHVTNLFRSVVT